MKKVIRLTENDLHRIVNNSVKKVLKEYKNKDTERFNTTGKRYDDGAYQKHKNRYLSDLTPDGHFIPDGAKEYSYHNHDAAKGLAYHGSGQQPVYDEWDRDEDSYYDIDDEQWLHDHPTDPRGALYRKTSFPTIDGGTESVDWHDFKDDRDF